MTEQFIDIKGYEGFYKISNLGKVLKLQSKKRLNNGEYMIVPEMILSINSKSNYPCVALNKNGIIKTFSMHRLMAIHFIPNNDSDKIEVNHIDKNIFNYSLDNLEWCTRSYNVKYRNKL